MTKKKTLTLGVCGPVDVGKTLLIKRVTELLAPKYTIVTFMNGVFTVEKINYQVSKITLAANELVPELERLQLSDRIDVIFIEYPQLGLPKSRTDTLIYLLDASLAVPKLPRVSGLILLNKIDLATYHRRDLATLQTQVARTQPEAEILLTDLKANQGLRNIVCWIEKRLVALDQAR